MQIKITVIEDQKQAVSTEFVEASAAIEYLSAFVTPLEQHAAIDEVLNEDKEEEKDEELEATTEEVKIDVEPSAESASSTQENTVGSPDGEVAQNATELSPEEARG